MFSDYSGIKLEINNRLTRESPNVWKLSNTLYIVHMLKKELKIESENM